MLIWSVKSNDVHAQTQTTWEIMASVDFWPAVWESSFVPCVSAALLLPWLLKVQRKMLSRFRKCIRNQKHLIKLKLTLLSPGLFGRSCQCLFFQLTHQLHLSRLPCDFCQIREIFRTNPSSEIIYKFHYPPYFVTRK